MAPKFRTACCLCGKPIPLAKDVYALDAEWRRRFPDMIGNLACPNCAVHGNQWKCHSHGLTYAEGHLPSTRKGECFDSWDHIEGFEPVKPAEQAAG